MLMTGLPMVGSLFFYWVLVRFIIPPGQAHPESLSPMRIILYAMAVGKVVVILTVKKIMLAKKPQEKLTALITKLKTSMMVTLGLCEAPALYGVILYFTQGTRQDFYILAGYSLLLFAVFFPRLSHWQEYTAGAGE